jgi:hypothetical protein
MTMTVRDLIGELLNMPLDSEVLIETDEGDGEVAIVSVKQTVGFLGTTVTGWTHLVPKHDLTGAA